MNEYAHPEHFSRQHPVHLPQAPHLASLARIALPNYGLPAQPRILPGDCSRSLWETSLPLAEHFHIWLQSVGSR